MVGQLKREHGLELENKRRCPLYSADGLLTELVEARWDVCGEGKKPLRALGAGFIADLIAKVKPKFKAWCFELDRKRPRVASDANTSELVRAAARARR
jgi:hypothetical protein